MQINLAEQCNGRKTEGPFNSGIFEATRLAVQDLLNLASISVFHLPNENHSQSRFPAHQKFCYSIGGKNQQDDYFAAIAANCSSFYAVACSTHLKCLNLYGLFSLQRSIIEAFHLSQSQDCHENATPSSGRVSICALLLWLCQGPA